MDPLATLQEVNSTAASQVAAASSVEELDRLEASLLGKDSTVGEVRRGMAALDPVDRPKVGAKLNEVTSEIQRLIEDRRRYLLAVEDAVGWRRTPSTSLSSRCACRPGRDTSSTR